MRRKEIIILTDFSGLDAYFVANKDLLKLLSKEFSYTYFVNCTNLKTYNKQKQFQKKIKSKFPKKIKFFNPKNFKEFDNFLDKKKPLIINNIGRGFEFYKLLYFLKKKNIPQVLLGNVGNIQASTYYWHLPNFKLIIFLFTILIPRWISTVLVFIGIFNPIDVRFVSNKKHYDYYLKRENNKKFLKLPRYYKKLVLVKGKIFDNYEKYRNKLEEKYILLLEMQPEYRSMSEVSELKKDLINAHYKNLNNLLHKLSKTFKKKVIISIHPEYNLKIAEKRYPKLKVAKLKTKDYILKSFLILFFDSSAILPAFVMNKKVITLRSKLFKGIRYNSDLYKDYLNLKSVNINNDIKIDKNQFIKDLENRTKSYYNYLKTYSASNLLEPGNKFIIKYFKKKYF